MVLYSRPHLKSMVSLRRAKLKAVRSGVERESVEKCANFEELNQLLHPKPNGNNE